MTGCCDRVLRRSENQVSAPQGPASLSEQPGGCILRKTLIFRSQRELIGEWGLWTSFGPLCMYTGQGRLYRGGSLPLVLLLLLLLLLVLLLLLLLGFEQVSN